MTSDKPRLRCADWQVLTATMETLKEFANFHHYAKAGSNTATFRHGLYRRADMRCMGVAWWIPPTRSAAEAHWPKWQAVLVLHRLVCHPDAPRNAASFLIARSIGLIREDGRWEFLMTYADEWRGHTGAIYKATNWKYLGKTKPERTYVLGGRMLARKAGGKTRTHSEMLALGAECVGSFAKHRYGMQIGGAS